jgi:hypothetical protein
MQGAGTHIDQLLMNPGGFAANGGGSLIGSQNMMILDPLNA